MAIITKQLAIEIAKKLKAEIVKKSPRHDIAVVRHDGKVIADFGIRRGSNKELGHDHIPEQIFLRPSQARLLAQCPMSRKDWLEIITEKGNI